MATLIGSSGYSSQNGWVLLNNVWNQDGLTEGVDYTIQATTGPTFLTTSTTFQWSFRANQLPWDAIRAFPDVLFGVSPWGRGQSDPTHVFPIQVKNLYALQTSYDLDWTGATGGFDVAYDIWFTSKPGGDTSTITNELMIWLHRPNLSDPGQLVGTYNDGGFSAKIYHSGTYTAIVADSDTKVGSINIIKMIQALEGLSIIKPTEFLASVQLGAEVVQGNGSLKINHLDLGMVSGNGESVTATNISGSGASKIATLPYTTGSAPILDASGTRLGTTSTNLDSSGAVVTQKFDNSSKLISVNIAQVEVSGAVLTQHFNGSWQFTGAETIVDRADGSDLTQHYDTRWNFTGAETMVARSDGSDLTQHYDARWDFTGAESISATADGSTLTQNFSNTWAFLGADSMKVLSDGDMLTQHFDQTWKFVGADKVITPMGGAKSLEHFDQNWNLVSGSASQVVYSSLLNG